MKVAGCNAASNSRGASWPVKMRVVRLATRDRQRGHHHRGASFRTDLYWALHVDAAIGIGALSMPCIGVGCQIKGTGAAVHRARPRLLSTRVVLPCQSLWGRLRFNMANKRPGHPRRMSSLSCCSSLVRLAAVSQLAPGAGTGLPARLGSGTAEEPGRSTPPTMKKPRRVTGLKAARPQRRHRKSRVDESLFSARWSAPQKGDRDQGWR